MDKEELSRILHFNLRLKGDCSGKPVIGIMFLLSYHDGDKFMVALELRR